MIVSVDIEVLSSQVNKLRELVETYHADMAAAADVSSYSGIPEISKFNSPLNESVSLLMEDYDKVAASMLELVEELRLALTDFETVDAEEAEKFEQLTGDLDSIESSMSTEVAMIPAPVSGGGRVGQQYSIV